MSMNVGVLQAQFAKMDPEAYVKIAVNGTFVPIVGATDVFQLVTHRD